MIRRILFITGIAAGVLGLVFVVAPGLVGGVGVSDILVYLLGGIALLLAIGRVQHRRKAARRETPTPDPETPVGLPSPGDDVNERIRNLSRLATKGRIQTERQDLDARLEELAVRVLARSEDISREDARTLLNEGSWTEDRKAAAYFSEAVTVPLPERVRLSIRTGSPTGVYAIHAIEALADRATAGDDDE